MVNPRARQKPTPEELARYMPVFDDEKLKNASPDLKACADVYGTLIATARCELEQLQSAIEKSTPQDRNRLQGNITQLKNIIRPMHEVLMPLLRYH